MTSIDPLDGHAEPITEAPSLAHAAPPDTHTVRNSVPLTLGRSALSHGPVVAASSNVATIEVPAIPANDAGIARRQFRKGLKVRTLQITRPSPAFPTQKGSHFYLRYGKPIVDGILVLLLSPLWLPIYLLIAGAILIIDGRPVHYFATRPGQGCEEFRLIKFRTMRAGADADLDRLLREDPMLAEEYQKHNKLKADPRVTTVGAFLRRTSLDEIPQLFNVLRGQMSLVGPRPPATASEYERFYGELAGAIFERKPGLTGLWQVSRQTRLSYERKVWLDLIYAYDCTMWGDIKILLKTVPTVVLGHGAF